MTRTIALIAVVLFAAAVGVACAIWFIIILMFEPSGAVLDTALTGSFVAIAVSTLLGIAAACSRAEKTRRYGVAASVLLSVAAGFAVPAVNELNKVSRQHARVAEDRRIEAEILAQLAAREADVAARVAGRRAYTPAEALAFVDFVDSADLSWRSLPDYSPRAVALLERALKDKLVDPNVLVKGPRPVDVAPEPLFLHYYKFNIAPVRSNAKARHWRILMLLVDNGADLTVEGAAPLADELARMRSNKPE